ncbi:cobalamin 5'-phosphate synthase [Dethiosulfovibrio peptidovorans DSM 11002]|uniref:Adenosylcobinamide-GDP ribazoletransferase n=1 Tax=Dethiosulfovibrio peptidovorans DSM 11002 TaxID=469381 RepID=D2Z8J1_9BACT|nr:adenosylcobinamide-GDP ribazoletransferase [Dethiosulfovibrio peptidovorans]EFC91788.1 cobalamin 5'-phosphate synthase [Dethiosulfovibrio peptidovorans DSM 11002]
MRFLLALSFLTCIPVSLKRTMTEEDLGHATRWFPLVGAVIGLILWGVFRISSSVWGAYVAGASTLAVWAALTRGLHLDGLADTFDGLGGGVTKERALEIMKDSRIGTFGAVAIFCLLTLKLAVLSSMGSELSEWIFVAPVLSRWSMVLAVAGFSTARKNGLGRRFKSYCGVTEMVFASFLGLVPVVALTGWKGLAVMGGAGLTMWFVGYRISSSLGGLTGDSYGCICEVVELFVLLSGTAVASL